MPERSPRRLRPVRLALAAVASLVLVASAGAAEQKTHVTIYRPFVHGKLSPRLHVTKTSKGHCFSGSSADPRRDAWRCFIGANSIADPCFSDPKVPNWVACPADGTPFGAGIVRVVLSSALPRSLGNHGSPGQGNPWAIKLVDGKVCTFLTGATFAFHGQRVNYGCTPKVFLAGSPRRTGATWTILLGTGPKSKGRSVGILVAAW
jgi:hypothetical protein